MRQIHESGHCGVANNTNKITKVEQHNNYNSYFEEETPLIDLLIQGHMRRQHLENIKQDKIKLL